VYVRNPHASMLGGVTTDKLARVMRDGAADGMMSRLSLILMRDQTPSDDLDSIAGPAYTAYQDLVKALVETRPDNRTFIQLTMEGKALLGAAKKEWEHLQQHYKSKLPRYSERLGKLRGLAARVALLFALIEAAEVPPMSMESIDLPESITAQHMQRAIAWIKYQTQHDLAFYEMSIGTDTTSTMQVVQSVASWILRHEVNVFQISDLTKGVAEFRGLGKKPFEQYMVLDHLDQYGWCNPLTADGGSAFRGMTFVRGTQWMVSPKVHSMFAERKAYEKKWAEDRLRQLNERIAAMQTAARSAEGEQR
jgi:uncharacterized protein DUF3987